jgi:hypothetical protein
MNTIRSAACRLVIATESNLYTGGIKWGGWGSNSRPADYEEPVVTLRTHYLHGYTES